MADASAAPTSASPWMMGANFGPNAPQAPLATPPIAPEMGQPAMAGLNGGLPQEQEQPEKPQESVARHIIDALGGGSGHPMDWARSVLAGTLAGAANVGKVPEGGGFLAGAGRGFQGVVEQKRQQMLDQQKQQQIDFEKQEKLKADERANQELAIHQADAQVQRAMWNAQTAASIQTQQQNAARFPALQQEDQLRVRQLNDQIQQSERDNLSILAAAGVDVASLEHITSYDQLTDSRAKQIGSGDVFAVPSGEEHKKEEDGAGAYLVPGNIWDESIKKPVSITAGWEVDKNGKATPKTITAQEGTRVGTLLAIAKGAQQDLVNKQGQLLQQSKLEEQRSEIEKNEAQAALAKSQIGAGGQQTDLLGGTFTPPPGGAKETNKIRDSFKKDADNLAKTEGTFNQFQDVLNDINSGKPLTGAQSVVTLFNAIGLSAEPLQGKGFRINHNTVEEHANSIGLDQRAVRAFEGLKTGEVITPQQVRDYAQIAMRSRHDAYVNKINEARSAGIDPSFLLPHGNGRPIDTNTAQIFYDTAGGNTPQEKAANALKAARQLGWQ